MNYDLEFETLASEKVIVIDEDPIIELFENSFPILVGRIDWGKVGEYETKEIPSRQNREQAKIEVLTFINDIIQKFSLSNEVSIFILSDNCLEKAYKSTLGNLKEIFEFLFFLPQHTYIIPEDGSWCLNYTFESDLFFGFSPNKKCC